MSKYDFAVKREEVIKGVRYLTVDTTKAHFQRFKWESLGDWGKKKFENMLFLSRMEGGKEKLKIKYAPTR